MFRCRFSVVEVGGPVDDVDGVGVGIEGATVMGKVCVAGVGAFCSIFASSCFRISSIIDLSWSLNLGSFA